jgi:hypothetical protein
MRKIAQPDGCSYDNCPGMWEDGDQVVVRGDLVDQQTISRQDGEGVVRLPAAMVLTAAAELRRG